MNKPKALILGDYAAAPYHPLQGVDHIIAGLLSEHFTVSSTEDRDQLSPCASKDYRLLICYADAWKRQLTPDQLQGLYKFVHDGGGFLVVHNGISHQDSLPFAELVGASFTSHPPYQKLTYSPTDTLHPITEGLGSFEMEEELYLFEIIAPHTLTFLLNSTDGSTPSPALWIKSHGQGRVAYLAPGHDTKTFTNPAFQKLLQRSTLWLVGML